MPTSTNDDPTAAGATNVFLTQRAATAPYRREEVSIQGDENPCRAIGFAADGILRAISVSEMIAADPAAASAALGSPVVTNEAELRAAVAAGGIIVVSGEIILTTGQLNITVAGTQLFAGAPTATGQHAKIVRNGTAGAEQEIIRIQAPFVELHGLEITANSSLAPLTFNPPFTPGDPEGNQLNPPTGQQFDTAIRLDENFDCSDFVIQECFIHHITRAIYKTGSHLFPWLDRGRIIGNRIESFSFHGCYLDWCIRDLKIVENWIWGRRNGEQRTGGPAGVTETHPVPGNAIWIGDYIQRCTIRGNDLGYCDRHGIEIVNAGDNDAIANDGNIVSENSIHDFVTPAGNTRIRRSMGITVHCGGNGVTIANNQIRNMTYFGIELHNQGLCKGNYVVIGNHIENIQGYGGYGAWGIAVNSCLGALVTGNLVKNITQESGDNVDCVGIEVAGGSAVSQPSITVSYDAITVANNYLCDAGNYSICATCQGTDSAKSLIISGNTIRLTADRQYRPTFVAEIAVVIYQGGTSAVVKDNVLFYPASKPPAGVGTLLGITWTHLNGFDIVAGGTVYSGHAADAAKVGSAGTRTDIGGSNLSIAY